jgi:hypothetical protein
MPSGHPGGFTALGKLLKKWFGPHTRDESRRDLLKRMYVDADLTSATITYPAEADVNLWMLMKANGYKPQRVGGGKIKVELYEPGYRRHATLRNHLIRLAHARPELRADLLPLIHQAAEKKERGYEDYVKDFKSKAKNKGKQELSKKQWQNRGKGEERLKGRDIDTKALRDKMPDTFV